MPNDTSLFEPTVNGKALSHGNFETNKSLTPERPLSIVEIIGRIASDPSTDVAKMQELLGMQKEFMAIEAEQAFNVSMAMLQSELPPIAKHGVVDHGQGKTKFKFAKYEHIDAAIRPVLMRHGFSFSFDMRGGIYFGTISHVQGHYKTAQITLKEDVSGSKNSLQAIGSSSSYARRYLVSMLLNIVTIDEDDDAMSLSAIDGLQLQQLDNLVEKAQPFDEAAFLNMFNVKSVSQIQRGDYKNAVTMLKQKAINNKKKTGVN